LACCLWQQKLPIWAAILSSVVLYAGAAQYASIALLAGGVGISTLASNTLAINLRHAFYAIPLLKQLPTNPISRLYCLFALTDETFSVLTTLDENERQRLILPVSLLNQCYWVIGTILGILLGEGLNDWVPHLDFALVCLFAILAYEQLSSQGLLSHLHRHHCVHSGVLFYIRLAFYYQRFA